MSEKYWEIVEYECQDGKCLMIHNIPNDSKLGALSLDHRNIGEAIVEKLNEQQATIKQLQNLCGKSDGENAKLRLKNKELQDKIDWLCERYGYNGDGV